MLTGAVSSEAGLGGPPARVGAAGLEGRCRVPKSCGAAPPSAPSKGGLRQGALSRPQPPFAPQAAGGLRSAFSSPLPWPEAISGPKEVTALALGQDSDRLVPSLLALLLTTSKGPAHCGLAPSPRPWVVAELHTPGLELLVPEML